MLHYRKLLQFLLLGIVMTIKPTGSQPLTAFEEIDKNLDSIFKVGPGFAVFNTTKEMLINDEIICPERLAGAPFCTEVENYLEVTHLDKFSSEEFEKFKPYFKDDFIRPTNIANRMDVEPEESYFCNSKTRIVYPKVAESSESRWLIVVQHQKYRQGVRVEQCENENTPCKYEELLPFGITSRCKQHFVYRSLVVLVDGVMQERMVKLPTACKCVLRNVN